MLRPLKALRLYEQRFRPFTPEEAWTVFRWAAIAEAVGWSLLIIGIGLQKFVVPGSDIPVVVAGRTHGTFFIIYLAVAVVCYPSLRWRRWAAVLAILAAVPPYGSLIFEIAASQYYRQQRLRLQKRLFVYRHFSQSTS